MMETIFTPEYLFIQSNTLYISSEKLSNFIQKQGEAHPKMISLDAPILWERLDNQEKTEVLLHIDWNAFSDLITIQFSEKDLNLLQENREIESLGILVHFDPDDGNAEQVIFIMGIQEGLRVIL